jgi:acetoin utilization protein AcuB
MAIKLTVSQFMTRAPHTVGIDQSLSVAHRIMRDHDLRHLPVLAKGKLVGLVSERDLAIAEALRRLDIDKATVDKAMRSDPYCVSPDTPLVEVARSMAACRHGSAVILDGDVVVGIFTTVDALLALAYVVDQDRTARSRQAVL